MTPPYYKLVKSLRQAFPQPVSDRVHDAYFVFSIMRALDQVDAMKSVSPVLGSPRELDFDAARQTRIAPGTQSVEEVTRQLVDHLSGVFVWGHPRAQINVIPPPTIPGIIGSLLPSIYNPNLASEESSRQVALSEVEVSAMTSDLVGYDPAESQGVFTFGGTGTLMYAARIGLEKACPGCMKTGRREPAVIVASECAHYACRTIAGWIGLGEDSVIQVPSSSENEVRTCLLETMCRDALKAGKKIAMIVATMGTTDAFGLDDLAAIREIRDRLVDEFSLDYVPHIHADAVIGWAWSVFNDYDFDQNPQGFRPRTVRSLAGTQRRISQLHLSDSLGIDFHKTGFTPYTSSLFLSKSGADLALIARDTEAMPYLFQSGEYHPGKYTLETSRSGAGPMAALGNLLLLGREGFQALLGHLVTMSETLAEHLEGHAATTVLNSENFGTVTLFRVYPNDVDTFTISKREMTDPTLRDTLQKHNDYNRRIFAEIQAEALQGRGVVLSLTDCYRETDYGEPVVALKSYIMSPFSDEKYVDAVLDSVCKAREAVRK
ncbi:MAG: pyridoxal phosphate-dependent decarboxylase family protein [Planctomycetales bacterium]